MRKSLFIAMAGVGLMAGAAAAQTTGNNSYATPVSPGVGAYAPQAGATSPTPPAPVGGIGTPPQAAPPQASATPGPGAAAHR